MLNVGIVGCGKMGRVHAEIFSKNKNCKVTGLYNRTIEKALEVQKKCPEAKIYQSWQKLVSDKNIHAIAISTPQYQRLEQYRSAIKHGKHLFIEKPMSLALEDLNEAIKIVKKSECCFYVDSQIRSHPAIIAINRVIEKIGRIFHIDMEFSMYRDEIKWKHELIAGGGVLRELCGHLIDQASDWLGEVKSVTSNNKIVLPGREVEDFSINMIEYANGATLLLSGNYFEHSGRLYRGRILGELGQIDFTFSSYDPLDSQVILYIREEKHFINVDIPKPEAINSVYPGHMDSFEKEITRFVECVIAGEKALDTLQKEWDTTQVICASYESTRKNEKIFLPLNEFKTAHLKDCFKKF